MTKARREKLLLEARIHYMWLRDRGNSLDDIEVTTREILRLWNIDATAEVIRLQKEAKEMRERFIRQNAERSRIEGHCPDDDATGVII